MTGPARPQPTPPRSNIELKARVADLDRLREIAQRLATEPLETQHQVDTYFQCRRGRLKLREINDQRAELIWYERANQKQPTASHYGLVRVDDPTALKQALAATVGIRVIVEKQREIYLHHNVRIHLDRVVDLGTYLEFESVLSDDIDAKSGTAQVNFLIGEFGIAEDDLCTGSYAEMLEEHDW